jgi:hypothetical protein
MADPLATVASGRAAPPPPRPDLGWERRGVLVGVAGLAAGMAMFLTADGLEAIYGVIPAAAGLLVAFAAGLVAAVRCLRRGHRPPAWAVAAVAAPLLPASSTVYGLAAIAAVASLVGTGFAVARLLRRPSSASP